MAELQDKLSSLRKGPDRSRARDRARGRRRWPVWLAIVAVVAIAAWLVRARMAAAPTDVETSTPTVMSAAQYAAGAPILSASGYVVARREAVVSSKIQGRLTRLDVEEGDVVDRGDFIARLESDDFAAQLARAEAGIVRARAGISRAEADLAEARRQFRIAERLVREEVARRDDAEAADSRVAIAEAALAQAGGDLAIAQADRRIARANLENTTIRAPFAGTIVKKMAEVGESVAPIPPGVNISTASGAIVALADLATLEVEVDVSESNVARLHAGTPAWIVVDAFPADRLRGTLRQVIPTADRTKATVLVKVTILDADERLRPEMSAQVDFLDVMPDVDALRDAPAVILVPPDAIVGASDDPAVFVVDGEVARRVPITTGTTLQGAIVAKTGLDGSERIVVRPAPGLRDGAKVAAR